MRRENAGWVTWRNSAEREKLWVSARLMKSSSHFRSIGAACGQRAKHKGMQPSRLRAIRQWGKSLASPKASVLPQTSQGSPIGRQIFPLINGQHQHPQNVVLHLVNQAIALLAQVDFVTVAQVTRQNRARQTRLHKPFFERFF